MDVARAGGRRPRQHAIDRAHRGLLGGFVEFLLRRLIGLPASFVQPAIVVRRVAPFLMKRLDEHRIAIRLGGRFERRLRVEAVERRDDLVLERDERLNLAPGSESQIVEGGEIVRVRDRHLQHRADLLQRHRQVLARDLFRQRLHRGGVHGVAVQPCRRHAELHGQRTEHRVGSGETEIDQHVAEASARGPLLRDRYGQLFRCNEVPFHEQLAERDVGPRRRRDSKAGLNVPHGMSNVMESVEFNSHGSMLTAPLK